MITPLAKTYGLAALLGLSIAATQAQAAVCSYRIDNEWNTGFVAIITITNNGTSVIDGWNVGWRYTANSLTNSWNATLTGSNPYSASALDWNKTIQPGQSVNFGFQGNKNNSASAEIPAVTGAVCGGGGTSAAPSSSSKSSTAVASSVVASSVKSSTPVASSVKSSTAVASSVKSSTAATSSMKSSTAVASSVAPSSVAASSVKSSTPVASSSRASASSTPTGTRLDNPFVGATWYVDPIWSAKAMADGGSKVAGYSTAVWMDRIGAIAPTESGSMGLREHLDAAIDQNVNLIKIVIYDLPNRDCNALASNGELLIAQNGFNRYKNEYITPIVNIFSDAKYKNLRIIAIIEPDSLPNLVTNTSVAKCQEAAGAGGYVEATQFTLNSLYPLTNVYSYVDIGHSGWLGWDNNLNGATQLIADAIKGTTNGVNSVAGFISNTANTTPLKEPFLDSLANSAFPGNNSQQVRQAKFYEWNPHFSETSFVTAWRNKMISLGFPSTIGMLVDTSRNGWGGTGRPTALSTSTDLETFVNTSKIDRRFHRGNWCNQASGIGERPTIAPAAGIDAYVWIKPPGESDGVAKAGVIDPQDPAKGFDRFCDPTYTTGSGTLTGAMADAPHAGRWFSAGFKVLLQNAYPPL
jgi:cellulose 1,4-beta-cellobiosidase